MEDKERVILVQMKWSHNLLFLVFCSSLHTLVNKYVLSVLKFQYPTLFISWQCGICMLLLVFAHLLGYTKLSKVDTRTVVKTWLPCMALHTAVMYCGSVSLSKLEIPIFIGLQNLIYWCIEILNFWKSKLLPPITVQLSLIMIGFGAILLLYLNLKADPVAYKWISAYILCLGFYTFFFEVLKDTKLSALDRVFYNSSFCVTSLTILSLVTREYMNFFEFPFRHHGRFILSCWSSGVLHFLTSILPNILTKETSSEVVKAGMTSGRFLVSIISLGVFETTLNAPSSFSILLLLLGGMVYALLKLRQSSSAEKSLEEMRK